MITAKDMREFTGYLRKCTDRQVYGVYDKEIAASRGEYAVLALLEMDRRGLERPEGADDE